MVALVGAKGRRVRNKGSKFNWKLAELANKLITTVILAEGSGRLGGGYSGRKQYRHAGISIY
jgi:hypothetical protein